MEINERDVVGRVLRASTRGFSLGTHSTHLDYKHDFGAFVKVPIANDRGIFAIGVIYAVEIKDDLLISELVMAESIDPNVLRDQRENRMIPVEINVLNIGYSTQDRFIHSMPPRPPMSLSQVTLCSVSEVQQFTQRHDFFRLILNASEVPSDDLIAAVIRMAALAYPDAARYTFLVEAGRSLTRLLGNDARRLSSILSLIRLN
ncbi:MAG: hypothetical protein CUN56_00895 [Phototrophicales bacterium]|nr:MAG: hypothetical protein CUN56_00895 [Phototrophicales bacterium]RMG74434.1 MAG: hypothetical protein D6711_08880 [Chloroflexota bacterium]